MNNTSVLLEEAGITVATLKNQLAQLRSENRYLRSKTAGKYDLRHLGRTGRILRRALDDATAILALQASGYKPTRTLCLGIGISERRFFWGIGLLRYARIMEGNEFEDMDFNMAESRLHDQYKRLKTLPDALEILRMRMPKKMAKAE